MKDVLPIIYAKRQNFLDNVTKNHRLVFKYSVTTAGLLTLHGWSALNNGNDRFNTTPNIVFEEGLETKEKLLAGTYLGAQVVQPGNVKIIMDKLYGVSDEYVWLVPTISNYQVYWKFYRSTEKPSLASGFKMFDEAMARGTSLEEDANPSPPRNFN